MRNPLVPESLDSWSILHRMYAFDRGRFDALEASARAAIGQEALTYLKPIAADADRDASLAQILGHKADLMLTLYARSFDALAAAETGFEKLRLRAFLAPVHSYVSMLELGLYEATGRIHADLRDRGLKPYSKEWHAAFDSALENEAKSPHIAPRLWAKVPQRRYVCFYPMDKKRGESINWYALPFEDRARMMRDHGTIGRSFHGLVSQVISGSIGFDDWEWGVDLYADDPLIFKKLVYEMRFDEASAKYGAFGPFYTGLQFSLAELPHFLDGDAVPQLLAQESQAPVTSNGPGR